MGRKSIRIADEVYLFLVNYKREDESFSQAIVRLFSEGNNREQKFRIKQNL